MNKFKSEETIPLTPLERNCLFVVDPYEDGVEVDMDTIKPEVIATWDDLKNRGYINETLTPKGHSWLCITEKGREAIHP